jgi:hypothetical protein
MQTINRIHYRGALPTDAQERIVRDAMQRMLPDPTLIACWTVGIEVWHQHQGQGTNYRVVVDLLRSDGANVRAASDFDQPSIEAALDEALRFASRRLRVGTANPNHAHATLSDEARRLLPLHGWFHGSAEELPSVGVPS